MTERLYYQDSHLNEFEARVTNVSPQDGSHSIVTLDRTAFYPTGGGQPHDTGEIIAGGRKFRVVDCVDDEGDVRHIVEASGESKFEIGAQIIGRIDYARRLDHIQQHTAQHILSRAFLDLFDATTAGFRMTENYSEVDIKLDAPDDEKIKRAVERANQIVWSNLPVRVSFMDAEEAQRRGVRRRFERAGTLRVVEIENYDLNPCGGTHAHATGEVGLIAVRAWERAKGMTRIEFVAGSRALADYELMNRNLRRIASLFSVGSDEAFESVARLQDENKSLSRRLRDVNESLARHEAAELVALTEDSNNGAHIVARVFDDKNFDELKQLAHALAARTKVVALLAAVQEDGAAQLVFARSADAQTDMNALLRETCSRFGGRGGGRPDFAQGGGRASREQLDAALSELAHRLKT